MSLIFSKNKKGFTLVETLVGVAVFTVVATATYQAYVSLFQLINVNQTKIVALNLANEQFEIIRNLPYSSVGIPGGIPNGVIPHVQTVTRSNIQFTVTTTIRNVDLPFDGQIGSTTKPDLSPADNKTVDIDIDCNTCKNFQTVSLSTRVAPKNLETSSTNGALLIKVFDSNGVPVAGANVNIVNSLATSTITINDVTDVDGILTVVDAPPGVNAYKITVTKSGYSTDRTYTPGVGGNLTPTKPDATVIVQQLTQISFSIDKLSTVSFSSVTPSCTVVPNMDFSLTGEKLIGTNIYKYFQNVSTNGSGLLSSSTIEWDSYTVKGIDSAYDIIGINPLNPIIIGPDVNQSVSLIVQPRSARTLLVTVKDSSTQLPITGATVDVAYNSYNNTQTTGRGFTIQSDWSGGDGQVAFTETDRYFSDDGSISVNSPAGEFKLKDAFGSYSANGELVSSTIDTGSASNFYNFAWTPTDQPVTTGPNSVRFQIATSASSTPDEWIYKGPDGTSSTYYVSPNTPINATHNGDRYLRYKALLSTQSSTSTPNISDVSFTVTSSCTPPGQVAFSGLSDETYTVVVSKSGYTSSTFTVDMDSNWKEQIVTLSP
jgi:prepilin-type N-terminal cleavage/methylation domain-containing protein